MNYARSRRWTPLEVAIWLLSLLVAITLGILVVTNVIGSWALLIGSGLAGVMGLLRYRAETERVN